jgi:hypothetical protein
MHPACDILYHDMLTNVVSSVLVDEEWPKLNIAKVSDMYVWKHMVEVGAWLPRLGGLAQSVERPPMT